MSRQVPRSGFPSSTGYPTQRSNAPGPGGFSSSNDNSSIPPAPPLRPERSTRRPIGATPSPATIGGNDSGRFEGGGGNGTSLPHIGVTGTDGRGGEGKNRRMMDQLNGRGRPGDVAPDSPSFSPNPGSTSPSPSPQFGRLSPTTSRRYASRRDESDQESDASTSSRPHSPSYGDQSTDSPPLVVPSALQDAISAFSTAGKRANGRRGGLADQGIGGAGKDSTPQEKSRNQLLSSALNPDEYPDTPAFREVNEVLRKVSTEWPALARGTSVATEEAGGEDFDPVSLALHLLDPASSRERDPSVGRQQSLSSFLRLKAELDYAIQSTLSPVANPSTTSSNAFRAYETSITTHNMTLGALSVAQKQIGGLKSGLMGTREMLEGKGREGLAGMYARMGMLEEMSGVLDEIDHLLRLPPSLESLLSEKRFLSAVVLLVRSIKTLNKPEMQEIGALADLRAWAQGQETVMLEILIEELHNHLYLKSFYCDVRWKSYTRGQTSLPVVDFGDDADVASTTPSHLSTSFHTSGRSTARLPRMSKLQRFLQSLALKPSSNPMLDEAVEELMLVAEEAEEDASGLGATGSFSFGTGETLGSISGDGSSVGSGTGTTQKTPRQRGGRNPEVDSFAYIEMLIESLAALGKLGYALDAVSQRVQGEMFALVENTVEEVEERNDRSRGMFGVSTGGSGGGGNSVNRPPSTFVPSSPELGIASTSSSAAAAMAAGSWATEGVASRVRLSASETSSLASSVETLKDLFDTLYSQLDAVLQGFRVTYEVAGRIAERRDFKDASMIKTSSGNLLFSLLDVWKPIQQEVRALLHDYLQDDESGTVSSRNPIVSVNEVLRFPKPRDASKQIFKFNDTDFENSTKVLRSYEDSLNRALKSAVPGLITDGAPSTTTTSALIVASTDFSNGSRSSGLNGTHKALVPADAFNVSVLFGPTLAFLERVKEIMPGGHVNDEETNASTSFGGFLDEFVLRTFLPQLEDKVASVFHQAVGGIDAFQEDPNWKGVSRVPIVRSVSNLMLLISSLTSMLRATPFHRDNYSQLIVSVIHQFYQRCLERFKDLVSRETHNSQSPDGGASYSTQQPSLKTAAEWAGWNELYSLLSELQETPESESAKVRELLAKETKIELDRKRNGVIETEDLITPSKKLWALATLYSSLDWFVNRISALNTVANEQVAPSAGTGLGSGFAGRGPGVRESGYSSSDGSPASGNRGGNEDGTEEDSGTVRDEENGSRPRGLPLTGDMSRPFDALLNAYSRLSSTILYTLRIEIRLRTMHYLDKATRDGVYQLAEDIQEPDPSVVDLNGDLSQVDEVAAGTLGPEERKFVFAGLSLLMDQLLITNARQIRLANSYGLSKMNRNILALQQNLKNIGDEPLQVDFDRSRKFWELFGKGPRAMLDEVQTGTLSYTFDDYKTLLQLQLQIDQSGKDATGAGGTDSMVGAPLANEKNRRVYGEMMIELFSLDNGNDGED
ncbi:exocyst subunit SEC8 [Sporobolomyces salmoneus]|uniref:exocyst subunit SEC8 n=1 Tax=Sporobolomyces salmoneus TaxID=183962 RepID=UPI0031769B09